MSLFGFWHESGLLQGVAMEIYLAIHFRFYQESGLRRQQLATLTLIQENALECACCLQRYHPDTAREYTVATTVLSAELYSVCPVCGLSVADDLLDESYRLLGRQYSHSRHCAKRLSDLLSNRRSDSRCQVFPYCLISAHVEITFCNMVPTAAVNRAGVPKNPAAGVFERERDHLDVLMPITGGVSHGGESSCRALYAYGIFRSSEHW